MQLKSVMILIVIEILFRALEGECPPCVSDNSDGIGTHTKMLLIYKNSQAQVEVKR